MIAIIPARGGSKGLPGKNIRMLCGKPLIAHTIEAAKKSKYIERIIVTTDSKEIADVAVQYGAEVPFIRPDYLATDTATAIDVYIHAVEYLMGDVNNKIDKFMVLLPTAPLINEVHINEAVELFDRKKAVSLISVREAETPVTWYMKKSDDGYISNAGFGKGDAVSNRQANETYYIPNGAIYILDYNLLKKERTYYSEKTIGYVMSEKESVDIDTLADFEYAEYLIHKQII